MTLITYAPSAGYDSSEAGVVNAGGGASFDVGAALVAGGGQFTVDSSVYPALIPVLDKHPGLLRTGSSGPPPVYVDTIGPIVAHSGTNPLAGDILVRGADGLFTPMQSAPGATLTQSAADALYIHQDGTGLPATVVLTNSSRTFTAPQTMQGTGGTGTILTLQSAPGDTTQESFGKLRITHYSKAIAVVGQVDWSPLDNAPHDSIDIFHKGSTGDAIFAAHQGGSLPAGGFTFTADANGTTTLSNVSSFAGLTAGTPVTGTGVSAGTTVVSAANTPGANQIQLSASVTTGTGITFSVAKPAGTAGGNTIFNALIPYYLDAPGDGRTGGAILNNRTGMTCLLAQNQATNNTTGYCVHAMNWAGTAGILIENQNNVSGAAQGVGRALQIEEYNTHATTVLVDVYNQPAAGAGWSIFDVRCNWTGAGSGGTGTTNTVYQVTDQIPKVRYQVDSAGQTFWLDQSRIRMSIKPDQDPIVTLRDSAGTARFQIASAGTVTITDVNMVLGTTTGTKFGTAATQKLAFYNATPIVQPVASTNTAYVAGVGTAVTADGTFTGGVGASAYTIGGVVAALKNLGLIAA